MTRLLVVDAYDDAGRAALRGAGATPAGELYTRALTALGWTTDTADSKAGGIEVPAGRSLSDYAGVVWTGSNLSIHAAAEAVAQQIELARAVFDLGVPQFGSCWAIQLAAVAAGGECARNPRGREFGVAPPIRPTEAGRRHALLHGRAAAYSALTCHEDMVVRAPAGAEVLATNDFAPVQALDVRRGRGRFWAVQYHPEYDFHEIACLAELRREQLLAESYFADEAAAARYAADFRRLHETPGHQELLERYAVPPEVRSTGERQVEIANWLQRISE